LFSSPMLKSRSMGFMFIFLGGVIKCVAYNGL
jgi:hypothetical protein